MFFQTSSLCGRYFQSVIISLRSFCLGHLLFVWHLHDKKGKEILARRDGSTRVTYLASYLYQIILK